MATILITGGTGFVGEALIPRLVDERHLMIVLSRSPAKHIDKFKNNEDQIRLIDSFGALDEVPDAVINLAGEGIADQRWTKYRQSVLRDSRIGVTHRLADRLEILGGFPELVISGSAVGYYGSVDFGSCDELAPLGDDFSAKLCRDWELAAGRLSGDHTNLYTLRIGVVMGRQGGFLGRLKFPFSFGFGGSFGNGRQMLSWIHRDDLVKMIMWILDARPPAGPYNATSPEPVSNEEFTKIFAKTLKRPAIFRVPEAPLRLVLGDVADLLFRGQAVLPRRALEEGFLFQYPTLQDALNQLFR